MPVAEAPTSYLHHGGAQLPAAQRVYQLSPGYVEKLFRLGYGAEQVNHIEAVLELNHRTAADFEHATGNLRGVNKEAFEAEMTSLEAAAHALLNADPFKNGPPWQALGEAAADFTKLVEFLLSPKGWIRMAEIFGGAVIMYWAIKQLTGLDPAAPIVKVLPSGKLAKIKPGL